MSAVIDGRRSAPRSRGRCHRDRGLLEETFGGTAEAVLVERLRISGEMVLALVAIASPDVVAGFIAFVRLQIEMADGSRAGDRACSTCCRRSSSAMQGSALHWFAKGSLAWPRATRRSCSCSAIRLSTSALAFRSQRPARSHRAIRGRIGWRLRSRRPRQAPAKCTILQRSTISVDVHAALQAHDRI